MTTIGEYTLQVLAARQIRRTTVLSYIGTIKNRGLWDTPLESVTLQMLYEKLLEVTSQNTRRKDTVVFRAVFRDYPWIKGLKIQRSTPRIYDLPSEELLRFTLMLCPFELQGLLMMYAGLRCGEACATEPADIKGSVLRVFRAVSYDGSVIPAKTVGHVIIPRWLAERVENSEHKKLTPGMVRESFRRYGKKTGIHLNPHMLRHWYATMLVRGKVNPEIARRQMRHSDLKTTLEYYAQVAVSDIEDAINETFS